MFGASCLPSSDKQCNAISILILSDGNSASDGSWAAETNEPKLIYNFRRSRRDICRFKYWSHFEHRLLWFKVLKTIDVLKLKTIIPIRRSSGITSDNLSCICFWLNRELWFLRQIYYFCLMIWNSFNPLHFCLWIIFIDL